MNDETDIPESGRLLVACVRAALHDAPPPTELSDADGSALYVQARQQGVDTFLYPWLAARVPALAAVQPEPASGAAAWRGHALEALTESLKRQRQLSAILHAFAGAGIRAAVLKGAWLGETVYGEPSQRTMSDLDLLVRPEDRDVCHALLLTMGYAPRGEMLHTPYAYDQTYRHAEYRLPVELHWHVASAMDPDEPVPDMEAVWLNARSAVWSGLTLSELAPADQVGHLVQHQLHHRFAMPLRGYVDLALLLRKHGKSLTPDALAAAGRRWKTGRGIPFALRVTSALLGEPLPEALRGFAPEPDAERLGLACRLLFGLPRARERDAETSMMRFREASALGRLRLAAERVFMPREFLRLHYPCARHAAGVPLAWLLRARDLWRTHGGKVADMRTPDAHEAQRLTNADERASLTAWIREG